MRVRVYVCVVFSNFTKEVIDERKVGFQKYLQALLSNAYTREEALKFLLLDDWGQSK